MLPNREFETMSFKPEYRRIYSLTNPTRYFWQGRDQTPSLKATTLEKQDITLYNSYSTNIQGVQNVEMCEFDKSCVFQA